MLILIFGAYLLSLSSAKCIIHERANGAVIVPNECIEKQFPVEWGLARIWQPIPVTRCGPLRYEYPCSAGECATVYVIGSGIRITHSEFEGRAYWGANFVGDGYDTDLTGQGTHVAGIIGGKTFGVAKKVKMVAVKVSDPIVSNNYNSLIDGVNWVKKHKVPDRTNIAIITVNGHPYQQANDAVQKLIDSGVTVICAAGDAAEAVMFVSPASNPNAITVAGTDKYDKWAPFNNYGSTVEVLAPGVDIKSAWIGSNTATKTRSGTAQAAAFVAGVAATLFCSDCTLNTPLDVANRIIQLSLKDIICATSTQCPSEGYVLPWNTPNNLLQNGVSSQASSYSSD